MKKTLNGKVKGNTVVLPEDLHLPDGTEVEVNLPAKVRLLRHAGIWKNREDLKDIEKIIYESRIISDKEVPL